MKKGVKIVSNVSVKEITPDMLGRNPFVEALTVPVTLLQMHGQYKALKEVAADGKPIMLPVEIEIDADKHCKVFNDAKRRDLMMSISARGKDLLLFIIYETDPGKDYIWINKKRYMAESGISSLNTYKTALNAVIMAGFIAPTVASDVYWINPAYFYNGSRLRSFPEKKRRK